MYLLLNLFLEKGNTSLIQKGMVMFRTQKTIIRYAESALVYSIILEKWVFRSRWPIKISELTNLKNKIHPVSQYRRTP